MTRTTDRLPAEQNEPAARHSGVVAAMAIEPGLGCGTVVANHSGLLGNWDGARDLNPGGVMGEIQDMADRLKAGDLSDVEHMLVAQAVALQSVFYELATRAAGHKGTKVHDGLMTLALKAQSNSRATLSALVELKQPRQAVFAKQANVTSGPQQVNNGVATSPQPANAAPKPAPALELADGHVLAPEVPAKRASEPRARTRAKSGVRAKQSISGS